MARDQRYGDHQRSIGTANHCERVPNPKATQFGEDQVIRGPRSIQMTQELTGARQ